MTTMDAVLYTIITTVVVVGITGFIIAIKKDD